MSNLSTGLYRDFTWGHITHPNVLYVVKITQKLVILHAKFYKYSSGFLHSKATITQSTSSESWQNFRFRKYNFFLESDKFLLNKFSAKPRRWGKLYDLRFGLCRGLFRGWTWSILYGQLEETSIVPTIVSNLTSASEDGLYHKVFNAAWMSLV